MNRSFADTSFYVALVNPRDGKHGTAMKLAQSFRGIVITTQYVLLEVANSLSRSGDKRVFLDLLKDLESDTTTIIVPTSEDLYRNGLAIFSHRPDKDWSLTDCISFVVMERHGLTEALTADHHFSQAGFKVLL